MAVLSKFCMRNGIKSLSKIPLDYHDGVFEVGMRKNSWYDLYRDVKKLTSKMNENLNTSKLIPVLNR